MHPYEWPQHNNLPVTSEANFVENTMLIAEVPWLNSSHEKISSSSNKGDLALSKKFNDNFELFLDMINVNKTIENLMNRKSEEETKWRMPEAITFKKIYEALG